METLTKAELEWLLEAAKMTANYYDIRSHRAGTQVERGLAHLRSEQLACIAGKLQNTLDNGKKRIAVK